MLYDGLKKNNGLISIGFMIFIIGLIILSVYKYIPILQETQQDYKEIKKIDDLQSKILKEERSQKIKNLKEKLKNLQIKNNQKGQ